MEVQDLLRKKRLAQTMLAVNIRKELEDFYNQTGFLIKNVIVDLEYQMILGLSVPAHTNVVVRCDLNLESETQKMDTKDFLSGGKDFVLVD